MKEEFSFTNRRGAKITGLRISDPLSELPDVRISPAGKHRIDIPVLILHNHSTASSGILLVSDLTRIKQKTSVKSNQTAFVSGVPECKLENKVFDKDELFIVRLKKETYASYLKIYNDQRARPAIARINFDLSKLGNSNYEGYGNRCRIVYKHNLFREMVGIEREFINFIDRLKACVSSDYYKNLDQLYGFTEFVMTHGVSDEDIEKLSQNPTFLQSQVPNGDTDEDEVGIDNGDGLSPIVNNNDVSFSANPPSIQAKKDSVDIVDRVEFQVPNDDDDYDDDIFSDEDIDVGAFATAPSKIVEDQFSISQDIETDRARNGEAGLLRLQTSKSMRVCQFATITDFKQACQNTKSGNESTTFVIGSVNCFAMVPEVPLVITPSNKQIKGFAFFKLVVGDANGKTLATEFSHQDLCRFLEIPNLEQLQGKELQRVKQQFAQLLNKKDVKGVKLKSKTKILNRGIKLKTWCIESPISELI
ncbi:hypothetical protein FOB58_005253 [Candida parapsilosis]|uniref:Uncharacterized protein n=2 Tax=Candida parapsilosis TaxID=5480 RepID=G8B5A5_CANPC|nr:uncharacterized protein CPAR2_602150 [Candida parapsilosis]KAF6043538.1 hypothetical protein FOB58_005253 [Candida parapsilosis]KAF6043964.1 hypothetical protein FOB59_004920 [Candida parapsilosis]KAF6045416.1 hypothetical protein FOB60_004988 [Candida parapsilosis]KAF6060202.1 hypothetical protein FOB61_005217 [Candida parapsilosis]KAI5901623.1 hypothetical protein K4G60_g760 [Candida parapsilosis]